jgi:hypothetical protein
MKMCLLITNLSKSIYQGDIRVMSKQLGPKRLKLIRKQAESGSHKCDEAQVQPFDPYMTASWRRQHRTKSVELALNNKELIKEVINYSVTLLKKLLLTNSSMVGRLSSGLIAIMKKVHILHDGCKNRTDVSTLIKPRPVCVKLTHKKPGDHHNL